MSIRIRDAERVFADGFEPGVIATQEVEYNCTPQEYGSMSFIIDTESKKEQFLGEQVEVLLEEVPVD